MRCWSNTDKCKDMYIVRELTSLSTRFNSASTTRATRHSLNACGYSWRSHNLQVLWQSSFFFSTLIASVEQNLYFCHTLQPLCWSRQQKPQVSLRGAAASERESRARLNHTTCT